MREIFTIGIIVSSHGREGMMKIKSLSGETGHFHRLTEVILTGNGRRELRKVDEVKDFGAKDGPAGTFVLMRFEGISSPEEGMKYAGWEILTDRMNAAPLREGEYYISELSGCALVKDGIAFGTVEGVCESGSADLLEIRLEDGRTVFVPFIETFVGGVDVEKGTVELKQEWILE